MLPPHRWVERRSSSSSWLSSAGSRAQLHHPSHLEQSVYATKCHLIQQHVNTEKHQTKEPFVSNFYSHLSLREPRFDPSHTLQQMLSKEIVNRKMSSTNRPTKGWFLTKTFSPQTYRYKQSYCRDRWGSCLHALIVRTSFSFTPVNWQYLRIKKTVACSSLVLKDLDLKLNLG